MKTTTKTSVGRQESARSGVERRVPIGDGTWWPGEAHTLVFVARGACLVSDVEVLTDERHDAYRYGRLRLRAEHEGREIFGEIYGARGRRHPHGEKVYWPVVPVHDWFGEPRGQEGLELRAGERFAITLTSRLKRAARIKMFVRAVER